MNYFPTFLLTFGAAFGVSVALTLAARPLSRRVGIVARPGGRRQHQGVIPKLGGLPLMGGLLAAWGVIYWLLPPDPNSSDRTLLPGVMLGTAVLFFGGLLDDRYDLPPWAQFMIHFVGVGIAMWREVFIERFTNPLTGGEVVLPFLWLILLTTTFWIVGMINTVNWMDGLDGLAAGVGTIAALLFAWHSYSLQQFTVTAFPLALAGALLGFLLFNSAPASIHLGSAGAYLLGYQLATLSIISPAKIATALLVLAVPILDVAWRILDRLRQGRSPFHGDRGHLHHLLQDSGLSTRLIVWGYYFVTAAFGVAAVVLQSPLSKLIVIVVLGTAVTGLLIWLTLHVRRQQTVLDDASN